VLEIRNPQSAIRNRGQAAVETAFAIPLLLMMMFGAFQVARIYWTYHTLQKAVRGGAGLLARTSNVNYCDQSDPMLLKAKTFIMYGSFESTGSPILKDLRPDDVNLITIYPERVGSDLITVGDCSCDSSVADSCDVANGGRAPDFITVSLGPSGFPLEVRFPYMQWTTINLNVSVRMPVTGG
jgi:hypothetical protein